MSRPGPARMQYEHTDTKGATRSVLDTAHDAYVSMDAGGFITDWNPQAEATFGWRREDVLGRVLADTIVPKRFRTQHLAGLSHFLDTGEGPVLGKRLELEGLHHDGHEFPIEITISAVEQDGAHRFHAFLHDITERKRHQRYLEAQAATTLVLAEAESSASALPRLLRSLCETLGWESARCRDLGWGPSVPDDQAAAFTLDLPLGPIEFFGDNPLRDDPQLAAMMKTLSSQIGRFFDILSDREQLIEGMEHLALTDELTGLPNRRAWEQGLSRELARARRSGARLCVALLDLDHFKAFNDDHGHQAGDAFLGEAAKAWSDRLRESDLLARYGGEEFALVIQAADAADALAVVERLRGATPGDLTCSAGLALWRANESPGELVGRADTALYEAKGAGRDRSVLSE